MTKLRTFLICALLAAGALASYAAPAPPSAGTEFTVTGAAALRKLAKQMPVVARFNEARSELRNNQATIASLQLDTPILQAKFDKVASILREVAVDASAGLDDTLENPLTGFQVTGDPEEDPSVDVKTGVYAP